MANTAHEETTQAVPAVTDTQVDETHAAVADTHGEAATADESLLASFGINEQLFLFQLLNFAIVVGIVWFLILKPLTQKMEERKKMIDDSLDKVKEAETALTMGELKFQERIDEAKMEANKITENAYVKGQQLTENLKDKAKKEIEILIAQAKKNIDIERAETREEMKKEAVALISVTLEKIFGEKLTKEIDKAYIEKILKENKDV